MEWSGVGWGGLDGCTGVERYPGFGFASGFEFGFEFGFGSGFGSRGGMCSSAWMEEGWNRERGFRKGLAFGLGCLGYEEGEGRDFHDMDGCKVLFFRGFCF